MLKLTTHICKVTDKTLGVQPKSSCQSVHMSLLYYFNFFRDSSNLSPCCLVIHFTNIWESVSWFLNTRISDGDIQGERRRLLVGSWFCGRNKWDLKFSVLWDRDRHRRIAGHQRGYALKLEAGEEGLRNEVVEWSRIWQALIRKLSYFRNWQRSPMILWKVTYHLEKWRFS